MNELTLHPNVYATGQSKGLISLLERVWVREQQPGDGTLYIISGFGNYNGGVRFYPVFRHHIERGGRVVAFFGGSTRQNLTSKQVVHELLETGAEVNIVNRKRLMHAKSYGSLNSQGQMLIVTSGNFTGPGMSQNVEMALLLDRPTTNSLNFSWDGITGQMREQRWDLYQPRLDNLTSPAWQLLYDEEARTIVLDETDEVTMVLRLGHADTARIMADPGSSAALGTQYFWLSKDCFDFFPPLTIRNQRGEKATFSCLINMRFVDLNRVEEVRVTFEAENNLDFRLGTGPLRSTKTAARGDLALISRIGENTYEMRIIRQGTPEFAVMNPYAINFIGAQGKAYGFLSNQELQDRAGIRLGGAILLQ
jgi:hypothetical protein